MPTAKRALMFGVLTATCIAAGAMRASAQPPSAATPPLQLSPCRLEQLQRLVSFEAQCGELRVAENPAQPSGRQLRLFVARIPAVSRRKQPDPLFLIAGGPGMGASVFYPNAAAAFARIRRDRDIVLLDQRGTGRSNPLNCDFDEADLAAATGAQIAMQSRECLAQLQLHNDAAYFTTSVAVRDLDLVRAALGYERINLYGGSYGTRVAQHYARRYPQHTRSLILDGVVPPPLVLGPGIATDAQASLERIFARCRDDAACREEFGDPAIDYRALRTQLTQRPVEVSLADPNSGEPRSFAFSFLHLATVLRLQSYTADQASLLPLMLSQANRGRFFAPLAAQFLMTTQTLTDVIAIGMHNSVICTEDVPFIDWTRLDRAALAATYLGAEQVDALASLCKDWPQGPLDADLHQDLHSTVPALLLSGSADPVTPAAYGAAAAQGFTDVLHIVMPDQGHGQLTAPCMDRVMANFIQAGTARGLDIACTKNVRPTAFFTSLAGPAP